MGSIQLWPTNIAHATDASSDTFLDIAFLESSCTVANPTHDSDALRDGEGCEATYDEDHQPPSRDH